MSTVIIREYKKLDSQGVNRTYIEYECDHCHQLHCRPKKDTKGERNFCSPKCFRKSISIKVEVECSWCGIINKRSVSKLNNSKSGLYFCDRTCKQKAQSLEGGIKEIQPSHYGTGNGTHSYREKAFRLQDNQCADCGWKEVPEVLEVHHLDRNRDNNDISNLIILCPTHHSIRHYRLRCAKI